MVVHVAYGKVQSRILYKNKCCNQSKNIFFFTLLGAPFTSSFCSVQTNTDMIITWLLVHSFPCSFIEISNQLLGNVIAKIQQGIPLFPMLITDTFPHYNECIHKLIIKKIQLLRSTISLLVCRMVFQHAAGCYTSHIIVLTFNRDNLSILTLVPLFILLKVEPSPVE